MVAPRNILGQFTKGTALLTIKIDAKALNDTFDWLVRSALAVSDLTKPLTEIAEDFYRIEREWFSSEGGGRWRPLSPTYAAWKSKMFPGKKILRRSDRMYREFTGATKRYTARRNLLEIRQFGADYWVKHEEGDAATNLPQREVISPLVYSRVDYWGDVIYNHLALGVLGRRSQKTW